MIRSIPNDILDKLKERAVSNHRSVTKEVLSMLEKLIKDDPNQSTDQIIENARRIRSQFKGTLTVEEITHSKRVGLK